MAVDWRSGNGFFDKVGKVVALINHLESEQVDTAGTTRKRFEDVFNVLQLADTDIRSEVNDQRKGWDSTTNDLKQLLVDTLITPILITEIAEEESLEARDAIGILREVPRFMLRDSETINRQTWDVTNVPDPDNKFGGSFFIVKSEEHNFGVGAAGGGPENQTGIAEKWKITCTGGEADGATEGDESWSIKGSAEQKDVSDPAYQIRSSGGSMRTSSSVNDVFVANGGMEVLSSNVPDQWTVLGGSDSFIAGENPFRGSGCLCVNDSFRISQTITNQVLPLTKYIIAFQMRKVGLITGDICVEFTAAHTGNSFTGSLPTLLPTSDLWTSFQFVFNTAELIPVNPVLTIAVSNLIVPDNGSLSIDEVYMLRPKNLGFFVYIISGDEDARPVRGDFVTIERTRSNTAVFQEFFTRWYGIALPHASSPTVVDSLAT